MSDIAAVPVKAYGNANLNPKAHMHVKKVSQKRAEKPMNFLSNEELKPYMRLTDCSQISDGGAAAIFMSEEGLKKHGIPLSQAVEVADMDQGAGDLWSGHADDAELGLAKAVVGRMLKRAEVKPDDLEVA